MNNAIVNEMTQMLMEKLSVEAFQVAMVSVLLIGCLIYLLLLHVFS